MNRLLKTATLALASFSLFSCSGTHTLGDTEKQDDGMTPITIQEFLNTCNEIESMAAEVGRNVTHLSLKEERYIKNKLRDTYTTVLEGSTFSDLVVVSSDYEDKTQAGGNALLGFTICAMPCFGPLFDAGELEFKTGKAYLIDEGGWYFDARTTQITWDKYGFPITVVQTDKNEDLKEVSTFEYVSSANIE